MDLLQMPDLSKLSVGPQGQADIFGKMLDTVSTIAKHQANAVADQNKSDVTGDPSAASKSKNGGKDAMTPFDLLSSLVQTGGLPTDQKDQKASKTGNIVKLLTLLGL